MGQYFLSDGLQSGGMRTILRLRAAIIFVVIFLPHAAAAQSAAGSEEVYTVADVSVDVTAETAAQARERALSEGQLKALERLFRRLTRRADHSRLPVVDDRRATFMVRDFEISDEKTSSVRYLARVTYRFKSAEVRRELRAAGIPFSETASQPVLVLPVLRPAASLNLWDEPNPWRDAWSTLPSGDRGLVPILVPFGDLSDIADISAEQAADGRGENLRAIAGRYGARDALVAIASLSPTLSGRDAIDVAVTRVGITTQDPVLLDFSIQTGESLDELFIRAAQETAAAVEDAWIAANSLRFGEEQMMIVSVALEDLNDWVAVRSRLDGVPVVSGFQLRSLRRRAAMVELSFIGDEDQLADSLAQRDLVLDPPADKALGAPIQDQVRALRLATN